MRPPVGRTWPIGEAVVAVTLIAACGADRVPAATGSPVGSTPVSTVAAPTTGAPPAGALATATPRASAGAVTLREFPVPTGSGPHDVAPAADGGVWYTAQRTGKLGWLDPKTGQTKEIALGPGSAPHGVIVGPDGAPWVTDGGLNAIVRVDPRTSEVTVLKLPGQNVNLNTAAFDADGILWFTGQSGALGSVNRNRSVDVFDAPRGAGPYGITATPSGDVYYASLAGSYLGLIQKAARTATVVQPPTSGQGARRAWSDSKGVVWVSEWNAGQLGRYDPRTNTWKEWKLPGARPQAYAVFVDDRDVVWLADWGASAIVRFDPATEKFDAFPHAPNGGIRQLHGRPGEVWGALSALDRLIVATTR